MQPCAAHVPLRRGLEGAKDRVVTTAGADPDAPPDAGPANTSVMRPPRASPQQPLFSASSHRTNSAPPGPSLAASVGNELRQGTCRVAHAASCNVVHCPGRDPHERGHPVRRSDASLRTPRPHWRTERRPANSS